MPVAALILCLLAAFLGVRIGEAVNPGPDRITDLAGFDDPEFCSFDASVDDSRLDEVWDLQPDESAWSALAADSVLEPSSGSSPKPPSDQGFSQEQLCDWRNVEREYGRINARDGQRDRCQVAAPILGNHGDQFRYAKTFAGPLPGYVFTTRDQGTGYYFIDLGESRSTLISLDALVNWTSSNPNRQQYGWVRRPRHARRPDGRRIRKNRRKRGPSSLALPPCSGHGELADNWWKMESLWAIVTSNPNSWTTAEGRVLPSTHADALLLQETKLSGDLGVAKVARRGRALGWNATASMAHRTAADKCSGGCVVAVRRGNGIVPHEIVKHGFRHRFHIAWVATILKGGLHLGSVWLRDSEGLSPENLLILQEVAAVISQVRGPWILGGDWNLTPQTLQTTNWLQMVGGVIVAPSSPTCHASTYDFFVVCKGLESSVAGVQRIDDAGHQPHWPARLLIRGDGRRPMTRQLVRSSKVSGSLPHGPLPKSCISEELASIDSMTHDIGKATSSWYNHARSEWSSLMSSERPQCPPRFRWVPSAGPIASPFTGTTCTSATWRSLAQRIEECAGILRNQRPGGPSLLVRHTAKASILVHHHKSSTGDQPKLVAWFYAATDLLHKGDHDGLLSLIAIARENAAAIEARSRSIGLSEWRQWLTRPGDNTQDASTDSISCPRRPSKNAYRWIRGLTGWSRSPVGLAKCNEEVPAGDVPFDDETFSRDTLEQSTKNRDFGAPNKYYSTDYPLCDQADIEREADQWASLWKVNTRYSCDFPTHELSRLDVLYAHTIRRAALTFPIATGVGCDNIAPRAIARLSDETLDALGRLLLACEIVGEWGAIVELVLIVLLPKPDGGRRPIGLFPTIIRVWMRARSDLAKSFEASTYRPSIFGGAGMGSQRAAWQVAFQAEAAALKSEHYGQSLLDLVKAFEKIPHHKVVAAARKHGYNLTILRLTFAAYRLPRSIGVEGIYSRMVIACCGITAGSGFATVELRALLLDVIDSTYVLWPSVRLVLMVDDITIDAEGAEIETRVAVAGATDFVVDMLENELELEVSLKKSVVVGGSYSMAEGIARTSSSRKLSAVRAAKLLGVASGGGRKRSTKALAVRLPAFAKRIQRIHAIRKVGVRVTQLVRTAGTPAVMYGVEAIGMADSQLQRTRSAIARASAPGGGGKNPDLVLWAIDQARGTMDPAFDAHVLPIKFWALAVWQEWRPRRMLERALLDARTKLLTFKTSVWQKVVGPASAIVASAARLGWRFLSAFELETDCGKTLSFLQDSPSYIAEEVREAVRRWRFARITQNMTYLTPLVVDVDATPLSDGNRQRTSEPGIYSLDFVDMLGNLLRRSKMPLGDFPLWENRHATSLISAITGGQWPQARLASVRRWTDDDRCQLCVSHCGTLAHRHECCATMPHEGWPQPSDRVKRFIDSLCGPRRALLETRGLLCIKVTVPPAPRGSSFKWIRSPTDDFPDDAKWYIDGSLIDGSWAFAKRIGFGIVVASPVGDLLAFGYGVPPDWVRDASGAEAWALAEALRWCPFMPDITTDCLNLVTTLEAGRAAATDARSPLARIWVDIFKSLDDEEQVRQPLWMPSHGAQHFIGSAKKSNGAVVTSLDWRANRLVDLLAKKAASETRVSPQSLRTVTAAADAVRFSMAKLGAVTHAANNFKLVTYLPDGSPTTTIKRDSAAQKPHIVHCGDCSITHDADVVALTPACLQRCVSLAEIPPTLPMQSTRKVRQRRRAFDVECANELAFQKHWRTNRQNLLLRPSVPGDASGRLVALRERVRAREAHHHQPWE